MLDRPTKSRRFWTHYEKDLLAVMVRTPQSVEDIARKLGRSPYAVYRMIGVLGLKKATHNPKARTNSLGKFKYDVPAPLVPAYRSMTRRGIKAKTAATLLGLDLSTERKRSR